MSSSPKTTRSKLWLHWAMTACLGLVILPASNFDLPASGSLVASILGSPAPFSASAWLANSVVSVDEAPQIETASAGPALTALTHALNVDARTALPTPDVDAPISSEIAAPSDLDSARFPKVEGPNIFGSLAIAAHNMPLAKLVQPAFPNSKHQSQNGACERVSVCFADTPESWRGVLVKAQGLAALDQLDWINNAVNRRLKYVPDEVTHGTSDYWSPALDTMLREAGDCEDFAIVKMWLLQRLGFAAEEMFVVVVQSPKLASRHAVLAVRQAEGFMVLDNLANQLRADYEITDYRPIFSVNAKGLWLHGFPAAKELASLGNPFLRN